MFQTMKTTAAVGYACVLVIVMLATLTAWGQAEIRLEELAAKDEQLAAELKYQAAVSKAWTAHFDHLEGRGQTGQ